MRIRRRSIASIAAFALLNGCGNGEADPSALSSTVAPVVASTVSLVGQSVPFWELNEYLSVDLDRFAGKSGTVTVKFLDSDGQLLGQAIVGGNFVTGALFGFVEQWICDPYRPVASAVVESFDTAPAPFPSIGVPALTSKRISPEAQLPIEYEFTSAPSDEPYFVTVISRSTDGKTMQGNTLPMSTAAQQVVAGFSSTEGFELPTEVFVYNTATVELCGKPVELGLEGGVVT